MARSRQHLRNRPDSFVRQRSDRQTDHLVVVELTRLELG